MTHAWLVRMLEQLCARVKPLNYPLLWSSRGWGKKKKNTHTPLRGPDTLNFLTFHIHEGEKSTLLWTAQSSGGSQQKQSCKKNTISKSTEQKKKFSRERETFEWHNTYDKKMKREKKGNETAWQSGECISDLPVTVRRHAIPAVSPVGLTRRNIDLVVWQIVQDVWGGRSHLRSMALDCLGNRTKSGLA